jgi:tRNA threonylcarbamoyladenosine biosynthesis protein TsaB
MILAIDTATEWLGVALHDGTAVRAEIGWRCHRRHTIELAPTIDVLCQKNRPRPGRSGRGSPSLSDQAPIPGCASGSRWPKGSPWRTTPRCIGISTLDIVAHAFGPQPGKLIVAAAAGRGRVVWNSYEWQNGQGWTAATAAGDRQLG